MSEVQSGLEGVVAFATQIAEPDKQGKINDFSDWRFVELEGWTGAVTQRNGVCFMAAIRGGEKDLQAYLEKKKQ